MASNKTKLQRRSQRVRRALRRNENERPRLSVHRSGKNIYAQIIDDTKGATVVAASTMEEGLRGKLGSGSTINAASEVGKLIAARAIEVGVKQVVFDRGAFVYHGRVQALADAAREGGLEF